MHYLKVILMPHGYADIISMISTVLAGSIGVFSYVTGDSPATITALIITAIGVVVPILKQIVLLAQIQAAVHAADRQAELDRLSLMAQVHENNQKSDDRFARMDTDLKEHRAALLERESLAVSAQQAIKDELREHAATIESNQSKIQQLITKTKSQE